MRKNYLLLILLGILLAVICFVMMKPDKNTFIYQETNQNVSTKEQLDKFDRGTQTYQIVVLYKKGCKVCKKWQYKIIPELESVNNNTSYIEVSEEIPEELSKRINREYISGVKVPYILIFKNQDYNPIFWGRVNSENRLEELRNMIASLQL